MSRWFLLAAVFTLSGATQAADPIPAIPVFPSAEPCPVCVYGPKKETVHHPAYRAKHEPFCLRAVSLGGFLRGLFGADCEEPVCEPPRYRARLVKWEVTEERTRMGCHVERVPAGVPCPPVVPVLPPAR